MQLLRTVLSSHVWLCSQRACCKFCACLLNTTDELSKYKDFLLSQPAGELRCTVTQPLEQGWKTLRRKHLAANAGLGHPLLIPVQDEDAVSDMEKPFTRGMVLAVTSISSYIFFTLQKY